ncbi:hypothetical protein MNBD_ALPHA12-118 [hydrothermal vent metagenome]|uniref:Uncharacterized protein n=1 Tax=hydrothermal vent metagenome TaxID=652676 RepID=A0A3B0U0G6_9ZZZZ
MGFGDLGLGDLGFGDIILLAGAVLAAIVLFHPLLMRWDVWRAIVTPLASIIGSGFLVSGPILAHASGQLAWLAMLALCAVGYLYGSVMRHNIINIEPALAHEPARVMVVLERFSDIALVFAYFISVAFYLTLFAAFALRVGNIVDQFWIKLLTSSVLAALGLLGFFRGLRALERVEEYSVGFKLSIILGLIGALFVLTMVAMKAGNFSWPELTSQGGWRETRILLGLVILVQGFETSRYLGRAYDAEMRVKTMRVAQWISTAIYLAFIVLATRYFTGKLAQSGGETAIIDLLAPVGVLVAPLLIAAAMASQLSAAVADMNGSAGLLAEVSAGRFNPRWGYALAAIAAIAIVWSADIFSIITLASKAFLLYYGLQSVQAVLAIVSGKSQARRWRGFVYGFGAVLALLIIVLAIPAGA